VEAGDWFDCGNPDNLVGSRRRLLQARSFNSIRVDEVSGTLTKRSSHTDTLLEEIGYYLRLPDDLKIFFPRLVAHDQTRHDPYLTVEYYGYWTLSEIWVFQSFERPQWTRTFTTLARILDHFAAHTMELSPQALMRFYWDKTLDRVAALAAHSPSMAELVEASEVRLNGRTLLGWPALAPRLEGPLARLASSAEGRAVHGDLCFTNILMDPLSGLVKFVDPRGSFGGENGVYGDPRYDVAKLLHSVHGGYDQLIHGMYDLRRHGRAVTLRHFFPAGRRAVLQSFEEVFGPRTDLGDVLLIEGLLFLSMGALHTEDERRQTGMFMVGLSILNDVLEGRHLSACLVTE